MGFHYNACMSAELNQPAPDFSLPDQDHQRFQLSAWRGQPLLLVFYPGDNTPVCTAQLCDYRDGLEEFKSLGVQLVGISRDDASSHQAFRNKHALNFPLLTDANLEVSEAYGVRGMLGMKRAVFLLDAEHRICYRHIESVALFRRRREELMAAIAECLPAQN